MKRPVQRLRRGKVATEGLLDDYARILGATGPRKARRPVRVVTCIDDGLDFRLPARSESVDRISFSRWQYVGRAGQFPKFLADNRIEFLVMPIAEGGNIKCDHWPQVEQAVKQIAQNASVTALHDEKYVMYDLSGWVQQQSAR